jgi:predicted nucleic acid-binding protein
VEWLTNLYGKTTGLDTAPLIYFIEENPKYLKQVRTPDAIQLSTAITAGANVFLTNDVRLPRLKAIRIIALESIVD